MRTGQFTSRAAAVVAGTVLTAAVAIAGDGPQFELAVKRDKTLGATSGTLVFESDRVAFTSSDGREQRSWRYEDLRQIQVRTSRRVHLLTYEDQGGLRFGADRVYEFALRAGEVPSGLLTFLLHRVERPLLLAVLPESCCEPVFEVAVKHERQGKGSEGMLVMHQGALVYDTPREGHARFWRFGDIESVLRLDRHRLQVTALEGGALRPFVFQLKAELPEDFYGTLWAEVNGRTW